MDIDKLREEIEYDEGNVQKIYLEEIIKGESHLISQIM